MIWTIIGAVIIFSIIIFIHELGHFIAARAFDVKVIEFAIGMGPKLFKKQRGETLYSIRAIPFGGFCSMEGEDSESKSERAFSCKPWYARLVILAAGAFMNVLLGFVIFMCVLIPGGMNHGLSSNVIDNIPANSLAAGKLEAGDKIIRVGNARVHIQQDLMLALMLHDGSDLSVTVDRNGEKITQTVTPVMRNASTPEFGYVLNVQLAPRPLNFANLIHESFFETVNSVKQVFLGLKMLLTGQVGVQQMSGPVGVVSEMNQAAQSGGILNFLFLAAFITVNIGVMNLLPLPALDGGRILFLLIELIRRKPIPPEKEGVVHFAGLVLLLGLMLFITWNDIMKLIF